MDRSLHHWIETTSLNEHSSLNKDRNFLGVLGQQEKEEHILSST